MFGTFNSGRWHLLQWLPLSQTPLLPTRSRRMIPCRDPETKTREKPLPVPAAMSLTIAQKNRKKMRKRRGAFERASLLMKTRMMRKRMKKRRGGGGARGERNIIVAVRVAYVSFRYRQLIISFSPDREEEEVLEEDDLELLEENTGASFSRNRLTRLRRARDSESPPAPSSSKRKAVVESSDDDLDNDDLELPAVQDIQNIWDDERNAGGRDDDDDMDDDMDNFIEYEDEDEEAGGAMDEEAREERRRERRRQEKARRRALGRAAELGGIDAKCVLLRLRLQYRTHEYLKYVG